MQEDLEIGASRRVIFLNGFFNEASEQGEKRLHRVPYLVSIQKWPFSAISSSNCGAGCAMYYSYVSAQPLVFLDLAKNCSFLIWKRLDYPFSISGWTLLDKG